MRPKILQGDVIDQMKTLEVESIDCIITSPPYWGQRDYENDKQWGSEKTTPEYISRMVEWAEECKRVLKNEGTLFLNIGDKYSKKSLLMLPERLCIAMCENGWCLRNKIVWNKPNGNPSSAKDRFTTKWEYIYFFVKDTGKYYSYKYYQNVDALRIPHKGSVSQKPDFPNILTISEYNEGGYEDRVKEYNQQSVKKYKGKFKDQSINVGASAGGRKSKGIGYSLQRLHDIPTSTRFEIHRTLKLSHDKWKSEHMDERLSEKLNKSDHTIGHWFRSDPGGSLPKPEDWFPLKDELGLTEDKYDRIMTEQHYVLQSVKNNPKGKNIGDVWDIPVEHSKERHFAQFPTELPRRLIRGFCPPNGIVLDPFAGSGTTGLVAMEQGVSSIMIELNPEYVSLMEKRFN
jgi:DNA modification methylase